MGHTVSPMVKILQDLLIGIPLAITAATFLFVGQFAHSVGIVLLECLGAMQFGYAGEIIARFAKNNAIKQAEVDKMAANNKAVANEVAKIMGVE
jgi:hypothetical protein